MFQILQNIFSINFHFRGVIILKSGTVNGSYIQADVPKEDFQKDLTAKEVVIGICGLVRFEFNTLRPIQNGRRLAVDLSNAFFF